MCVLYSKTLVRIIAPHHYLYNGISLSMPGILNVWPDPKRRLSVAAASCSDIGALFAAVVGLVWPPSSFGSLFISAPIKERPPPSLSATLPAELIMVLLLVAVVFRRSISMSERAFSLCFCLARTLSCSCV